MIIKKLASFRRHKLNSYGFGHHYVIPAMVIVLVAFIGYRIYSATHADSPLTPDLTAATSVPAPGTANGTKAATASPNVSTGDPAQSIAPNPSFLGNDCSQVAYDNSSTCSNAVLSAINNARSIDGDPPLQFNMSVYQSLTPNEQLFVIANLERTSFGLPAATALTAQLDVDANNGALAHTDPALITYDPPACNNPNPQLTGCAEIEGAGYNYAGLTANALGSDYYFMYDDGNYGNWGHRHNIFELAWCNGENTWMGVAAPKSGEYMTQVFANTCNGQQPTDQLYTWQDAINSGILNTHPQTGQSAPFEIAAQGAGGKLWTFGSQGTKEWPLEMKAGTTPSITSYNGGYLAAAEGSGGRLWTFDSLNDSSTDTGYGMMPGTSPSITALTNGGWEAAFEDNNGGQLCTVGTQVNNCWNLGMDYTSSPSITAMANGGWEVAFQANVDKLYTFSSTAAVNATGLGMDGSSSPSITSLNGGMGYEVAFNSKGTDQLWTYGTAGTGDTNVGMSAGTSPSITSTGGNGYEAAFDSKGTCQTWTVGNESSMGHNNMNCSSSPSIAAVNGGYVTAYQSSDNQLWSDGNIANSNYDYSGGLFNIMPSSSPSIAGVQ